MQSERESLRASSMEGLNGARFDIDLADSDSDNDSEDPEDGAR